MGPTPNINPREKKKNNYYFAHEKKKVRLKNRALQIYYYFLLETFNLTRHMMSSYTRNYYHSIRKILMTVGSGPPQVVS